MTDTYSNLFDFDPDDIIPRAPDVGSDDKETIANLIDYCRRMSAAFSEYMQMTNHYVHANGLVNNINENSTIQLQSSVLGLTAGNVSYRLTGAELALLTGMNEGDTAFVTADGGGYVLGKTYSYDATAEEWLEVSNILYNTIIDSGQIALTQITNRSLTNLDSAAATKLGGIATGADVTTSVLNKVKIDAGAINLTTTISNGGFAGEMSTAYTAAKCLDETANNTKTALESTVTITSGGIAMSAGGKIMGGKTSYPDAATAGYYLGYNAGTSKYVFRVGNSAEYWDFDGANSTMICTGGKIGGALNYFNITGGSMKLTDGDMYNSNYTLIQGGYIYTYTRMDTDDYDIGISIKNSTIQINANDGTGGVGGAVADARLYIRNDGGATRIDMGIDADDDKVWFDVTNNGDSRHVTMNDTGTPEYDIKGFTLTSCALASGSGCTIDASLINTGTITASRGGTGVASYTAGDMLYASGTTTLSKLAKGTAGQALHMNSGATAPEWFKLFSTGTYDGTGAPIPLADIDHNLGRTPKFLLVTDTEAAQTHAWAGSNTTLITNVDTEHFDVTGVANFLNHTYKFIAF